MMKLFQIFKDNNDVNGKFSLDDSLEDLKIVYSIFDEENNVFNWVECENPLGIDEQLIKDLLIENNDYVYRTFKGNGFVIRLYDEEIEKDRIFVRKEDREIYEAIRKNEGDLKGLNNMDIFLIAMILGFEKKGRQGLKGIHSDARDGFVRDQSFNSDHWRVIKSFAVYEEGYMEVLLSNNNMFDVAEKSANVGIQELNKLYFENEYNFLKRMEKLLIDSFKQQNIAKDNETSEIL